MRTSVFAVLVGAFLLSIASPGRAADSPIESSQTAFERWVTLQESIASEKSDWGVEKEYLGEEIRLLEEEIAALTEKRNQLTNETATIKTDLQKLDQENTDLKSAAGLVVAKMPELEIEIRALNSALPPSLQSTIETLVNRLPKEGSSSPAGASERLQVVVGILSQVDKANGQLTVATEIKNNAAGEQVQVRVLYLGLAQAWFVSQDGKFAGSGQPGPNGWDWTQEDSLAPIVSRAISIHDGIEIARYVDLPVSYN